MQVAAEFEALIEALKDFPKIGTVPVADLRAFSRSMPSDVGVHAITDLTITDGGAGIPARLYRPADETVGLIVYYHGGGWTIGDLDTVDATMRLVANKTGCSILSVDYRLAPEHVFPAAVDDSMAAFGWAAARRWELTGRADAPLMVMGDSAGGNLAAVVAQQVCDAGGAEIALQILVYPVTEGDLDAPGMHAFTPPLLSVDDLAWFYDQYVPVDLRDDPRFAPGKAADLTGLPPALILTAQCDLLASEGKIYADKLRAAGVEAELIDYAGAVHGFFSMAASTGIGAQAVAAIGERVARVTGRIAAAVS